MVYHISDNEMTLGEYKRMFYTDKEFCVIDSNGHIYDVTVTGEDWDRTFQIVQDMEIESEESDQLNVVFALDDFKRWVFDDCLVLEF